METQDLWVTLDQDPERLAPCEIITGRLGWRLNKPVKNAVLCLFWYQYKYRRAKHPEIVQTVALPDYTQEYEQEFVLNLPDRPYSFKHWDLEVRWALELVLDYGKRVRRVDLIVSPTRETIDLARSGAMVNLHEAK